MMERLKGNQHKFYLSTSISNSLSTQLKEQLKRSQHQILSNSNLNQSNFFYVLESFDNEEYREISNRNDLILIGAHYLLECLQRRLPLPIEIGTKKLSNCFQGQHIATTSIVQEELSQLISIISDLGGIYRKEITQDLSVLIASNLNTDKARLASKQKIPIVTVNWIIDCWHQHRLLPTNNYVFRLFSNVVVSPSKLDGETKAEIEREVSKHGGKFLPDLHVRDTTHLISNQSTGAKVDSALKNSILVVNPNWLKNCIRDQVFLDEAPYLVCDAQKNQRRDQHDPNVNHSEPQHQQQQAPQPIPTSSPKPQQLTNSLKQSGNSVQSNNSAESKRLFRGINAFVFNYVPVVERDIISLLQSGGGNFSNFLESSVTHVVVEAAAIDKLDWPKIKSIQPLPKFVNHDWVKDSISQKTLLACLDDPKYDPSLQIRNQFNQQQPQPQQQQPQQQQQNSNSLMIRTLNHMSRQSQTPQKQSTQITPQKQTPQKQPQQPQQSSKILDHVQLPTISDLSQDEYDLSPYDESHIFKGRQFLVVGFDQQLSSKIQDVITNYGGKFYDNMNVLGDNSILINYILVKDGRKDILNALKQQNNSQFSVLVSWLWVEKCVEHHQILDPTSIPWLFTPLEFPTPIPTMQSLTISFTGFEDRDPLLALIARVGAKSTFTLKSTDTHLLCMDPKGEKFQRALQWNIPIVKLEWLIQCAYSGRKIEETPYLLVPNNTNTNTNIAPISLIQEAQFPTEPTNSARESHLPAPVPPQQPHHQPQPQQHSSQTSIPSVTNQLLINNQQPIEIPQIQQQQQPQQPQEEQKNVDIQQPQQQPQPLLDFNDVGSNHGFDQNLGSNNGVLSMMNDDTNNIQLLSSTQSIPRDQILKDVNIAFSKKISPEKLKTLQSMVQEMGGACSFAYGVGATHFAHDGKHETTKDWRQMKIDKVKIVHTSWIESCSLDGVKVPEQDFPSTLDPRLNLGIMAVSGGPSRIMPKTVNRSSLFPNTSNSTSTTPHSKSSAKKVSESPVNPDLVAGKISAAELTSQLNAAFNPNSKQTSTTPSSSLSMPKSTSRQHLEIPAAIQQTTNNNQTHNDFDVSKSTSASNLDLDKQLDREMESHQEMESHIEYNPSSQQPSQFQQPQQNASQFQHPQQEEEHQLQQIQQPPPPQQPQPQQFIQPETSLPPQLQPQPQQQQKTDHIPDEDLEKMLNLFNSVPIHPQAPVTPEKSKRIPPKRKREIRNEVDELMSEQPNKQQKRTSSTSINGQTNQNNSADNNVEDMMGVEIETKDAPNSQEVVYRNPGEESARQRLKQKLEKGSNNSNSNTTNSSSANENIAHQQQQQQPPPQPQQQIPQQVQHIPTPITKSPKNDSKNLSIQKPQAQVQVQAQVQAQSPTKKFRVLLSNIASPKDKKKYAEIVVSLGGIPDEEPSTQMTHLVTPKITTSMKCLSACAAGTWFLKMSWLDASYEMGKWAPEEEHLWTAPEAPDESVQQICITSQYVRSSGKKLFKGMNVIAWLVSKEHWTAYRTIINVGGGRFHEDIVPPFNISTLKSRGITLAIFEKKMLKKENAQEAKSLLQLGIPCFSLDYLRFFLLSCGKLENADKYDLAPILHNLASS